MWRRVCEGICEWKRRGGEGAASTHLSGTVRTMCSAQGIAGIDMCDCARRWVGQVCDLSLLTMFSSASPLMATILFITNFIELQVKSARGASASVRCHLPLLGQIGVLT